MLITVSPQGVTRFIYHDDFAELCLLPSPGQAGVAPQETGAVDSEKRVPGVQTPAPIGPDSGRIFRASHVEPSPSGGWFADLSPVNGPLLGPFTLRSDALTAEVAWLEKNILRPSFTLVEGEGGRRSLTDEVVETGTPGAGGSHPRPVQAPAQEVA